MLERTYQYRLYPTPEQEKNFERISDTARALYNMMLADRTEHFRKTGKWKKLNAKPFVKKSLLMRDLEPSIINWVVTNLERSYAVFHHIRKTRNDRYRSDSLQKAAEDPTYKLMDSDLVGYPKIKKKSSKESWTMGTNHILITPGRVMVPGVGNIKLKIHRPIPIGSEIISYTILKKSSGHFFLQVHLQIPAPLGQSQPKNALGLALEPGKLVQRSDGVPVVYRHQTRTEEDKIVREYEKLCRRTPGSRRYEKQRRYLASLYEKRTNKRRDSLHKITAQIVSTADCIVMEAPEVQRKKKRLLKAGAFGAVIDEAWWTFSEYLRYKSCSAGKWLWKAPGALPVRNSCSVCGIIAEEKNTSALWVCQTCGAKMPAEMNAAYNLERFAKQYIEERRVLTRSE